jgi:hypothetical protein
MGVGNSWGELGLNKDGKKITTDGEWCWAELHICEGGAGGDARENLVG